MFNQRQAKRRGAQTRLTCNALRLPGHSASLLARAAKGERHLTKTCLTLLTAQAAHEVKHNVTTPVTVGLTVQERAKTLNSGCTEAGLRQMARSW